MIAFGYTANMHILVWTPRASRRTPSKKGKVASFILVTVREGRTDPELASALGKSTPIGSLHMTGVAVLLHLVPQPLAVALNYLLPSLRVCGHVVANGVTSASTRLFKPNDT